MILFVKKKGKFTFFFFLIVAKQFLDTGFFRAQTRPISWRKLKAMFYCLFPPVGPSADILHYMKEQYNVKLSDKER